MFFQKAAGVPNHHGGGILTLTWRPFDFWGTKKEGMPFGHALSCCFSFGDEGLLESLVAVNGEVAKLFFDAEELVVLGHAVGAAE